LTLFHVSVRETPTASRDNPRLGSCRQEMLVFGRGHETFKMGDRDRVSGCRRHELTPDLVLRQPVAGGREAVDPEHPNR
jgi:hypothetical protein